MAKAKKEAALTPEERLQAALVQDWEWPYKLPENWCWCNWGNCGDFIAGNGFKNEFQGYTEYDIPFYKVGSLKYSDSKGYLFDNSNTINEEICKTLKASIIPTHSILFAKIGEAIRLNRRAINEVPCCIDNNMMAYVPKACLFRYAYYWSQGLDLYEYTNATTVPAIRKTDLEGIPFPLAPLAEQQRIVDRIESLFAKLDEAKEKAQAVVDSYETRKAAILHKAFTGELTANWREAHDVGMESWENKRLGENATVQYGYTESANAEKVGPHFLRITDIQNNSVDWQCVPFCKIDAQLKTKYTLKAGDIVVARTGATTGKSYLIEDKVDAVFASYLIRVSILDNSALKEDYLYHYFQSQMYWSQITELSAGIAQPGVNGTKLQTLVVPIPQHDEQTEIVRILDNQLAKEQQAKEAAEAVLDQIDLMKKSILARAFRGELGTNDPTDEPAVELIKSVFQQKIAQESKPKKQEKKGNHKEENIVAKTILEVLAVQKKATPEALKKDTELDIDDFYDQVKALIASKVITEAREGNEVFLEVTHADRQANN